MRKVFGLGETVFDIIFKNGQPISATPGGSTFNSMISLGRAGVEGAFIGETGDDLVGQQIRDFLTQNHISAQAICIHKGQKSALSLAFLDDNNDAPYQFYKDHAHDRLDFIYPPIQPDDVVLFGSYYAINPVVRDQVLPFLQYAKSRGAILYYDVNFRASHQDEAEILLPNIRQNMQLAHITRGSDQDFNILYHLNSPDEIYTKEIAPYCPNFICTCAAQPSQVRTQSGVMLQYPVPVIKTVSTIGAGDSFNAGFIYGILKSGIKGGDFIKGLKSDLWDVPLSFAQQFAANACQSLDNCIDRDFVR